MQCCSRVFCWHMSRNVRLGFAGSTRVSGVQMMAKWCDGQRAPLRRSMSSDVIPSPTLEGEDRKYPAKIQKLVNEITELTLVEVADLNELLKKTLKLPDVPAMAFSGAVSAMASVEEEDVDAEPVKQEKAFFNIRLVKFDDAKKVALIKEIKNLVEGMNLVKAKKFVESLPQTVRSEVPKEEVEKLKEALTAAGGTVEVE